MPQNWPDEHNLQCYSVDSVLASKPTAAPCCVGKFRKGDTETHWGAIHLCITSYKRSGAEVKHGTNEGAFGARFPQWASGVAQSLKVNCFYILKFLLYISWDQYSDSIGLRNFDIYPPNWMIRWGSICLYILRTSRMERVFISISLCVYFKQSVDILWQ
jgi:hypothetical protein